MKMPSEGAIVSEFVTAKCYLAVAFFLVFEAGVAIVFCLMSQGVGGRWAIVYGVGTTVALTYIAREVLIPLIPNYIGRLDLVYQRVRGFNAPSLQERYHTIPYFIFGLVSFWGLILTEGWSLSAGFAGMCSFFIADGIIEHHLGLAPEKEAIQKFVG